MDTTAMIVCLFSVYAVFLIFIIYKSCKKSKRARQNRLKRYGATMTATLRHVGGLPLLHDVYVDVYYGPEKIWFITDKKEISIARSKITDIVWRSSTTKRLNSFRRARSRNSLAKEYYLIISYTNNGCDKYVKLDTYGNDIFALKMQKDFKQHDTSGRRSIEL